MGMLYPHSDNEDGFEQQCLRFYRKLWKNESLQLYAKRGEKQDGVDIFDPLCIKPIRAVQCKQRERTKTILPSEIKEEVRKAEQFVFDIDQYVIATSAKKSRNAQNTVAKLNERSKKKFTVEIHFWEDICIYLNEFGKMLAEVIVYGEPILAGAAVASPVIAGSHVLISSIQGADIADGLFAGIEKLIDERNLEIAQHELAKFPDAEAAKSLSVEHQYMLLRLRAKLALEFGEFATASQLFFEAYAVAPELDQAKQNQVYGFSLAGDSAKAYELATQYITEGLKSKVMVLRLIDSTTSQAQLDEHSSIIETHIDTDDNLNIALSHKYLQFGDFNKSSEAAERALKIKPDSPHAHFAAALSVHNACFHEESHKFVQLLQKALKHYNAAESLAREQKFMGLLPEILVQRAAVKMLSGDKSGAVADYRSSVEISNKPAAYAACTIAVFLQEEDYDSAWELLELIDRTTFEGQFLSIATEFNKCEAEDKRGYIDKMLSLAEKEWDRSVECRFHCVLWAIELKDYELADSCVPLSFQNKHSLQAKIMRAWIRLEAKDIQSAKEEVIKVLNESIRLAHPQELRLLSEILIKLKDDENAVGILENITKPGVFNDDMKSLIECAQRLDRHDLQLRICRELRESDTQDEQLRKLEVQLLNEYLPKEALRVAKEFVGKSSMPSYFVAFTNMIAARLDMLDEMNLDKSSLPLPAQLLPEEWHLIILPYVKVGMYDEALQFLYAQRRLYFEDESAHGRYIHFFLTFGQKTKLREQPSLVDEDCAVLLSPNIGKKRWVIIENEQPVASRDEFPTNSEISQRILRSKVGDVIELPGAFVKTESATVLEIQTKYVRAFQDSYQNFCKRFPETSMVQEFHVGDEEKFDPSEIVESLKGRREHVEKCFELYLNQPCSLHLFSDRVGITEFEAVKALAQHHKGIVKCCQTTPQEFEHAVKSSMTLDTFVLSITAIVSLTLIDGWNYLDSSKQYLVSQLTSDLIDEWIQKSSEGREQESGYVSLTDEDQLILTETSEADRLSRLEELRAIKHSVENYCERTSSVSMAALESEKRNLYKKALGMHNVEAMSIARDHNAFLWNDDLVIGIIGKTDFDVTCIWTQLAMRCFVESGQLSMTEFDLLTAKLASWDYVAIIWNAATIISAGEEARWNPDEWPLKQCLALIEKSEVHISAKVPIVVEFLKRLRRSSCLELKQSAVIQASLDTLKDARAVRWILKQIDQIFLIDYPSAKFIRLQLQYWLRPL